MKKKLFSLLTALVLCLLLSLIHISDPDDDTEDAKHINEMINYRYGYLVERAQDARCLLYTSPELATAVCLAKKDHIVDDFVYASVSPAYLSAMMDTL